MKNLNFLRKLTKIHGQELESNHYALTIYDNGNLTDLWPQENVEILNGSMFIHLNNKLCNRRIKEFVNRVTHDKNADSIQISDADVTCNPSKLKLEIEVKFRNYKFNFMIYY